MSNFSFIPSEWADLRETLIDAEQHVFGAPMYAAMLCRKSLEEWVRWMYEHDEDLELPYDSALNSLIHDHNFKNIIAPIQFSHINLIRKLGNTAVHSNSKIKPQEVLHVLQLLHGFVGWLTQVYSEEEDEVSVTPFDESLIPKSIGTDKSKHELQQLEKNFHDSLERLQKLEAELAHYKSNKEQHISTVPPPIDPNEAKTRELYINAYLRDSGWDPAGNNVAEYPVKGMPTATGDDGVGYADYVLWGDDGLPLAVVEAKRTRSDARIGRQQAKLYADCLHRQFGQRPVIYYTSGFKIWMWDDVSYGPREVHGFYTKDELQMLVQRRNARKKLSDQNINDAITDRPYQHEAIRRVTEALENDHREALLIMATGTGKTRVSASIIDLLSKANWAKRILFLADRNALIHQAKVNLNDYLPNLPAVDLTKEKEDESSRIVFSTYQTIIHMIDGERDGDQRFYGVGHFDLIIFDEIHRSVYNKYKHIFKYFDGIRIGLTATPRNETAMDKDTYALFSLEPGNPTYAYELAQAVNDKYLVPPKGISVPIKFQRQGIKYEALTELEKLKYEEQFTDPLTGEFPEEIDAAALNNWLFNSDTVDKVLSFLMTNGIKVEGGDKLAKTIIFARSHKHAVYIEERFHVQFPELRGEFMRIIDHQEKYRYDLLNKFKEKTKEPQIAVSVDMLDTGIDVPEVCNLVFFKPVRSSVKYWQMVGRGTRLCKDLFGLGDDKKEFIIFDFCGNFEFFGDHPEGVLSGSGKSLSQRLFELRLRLAFVLLSEPESVDKAYGQAIIDGLIFQTQSLNGDSFIVRQHWEVVEKYKDANAWNALSDLDMKELHDHIAPLMLEADQDEMAKRFDALMLDIQLSVLNGERRQMNLIQKVVTTAGKLTKKASIPSVGKKMELLKEVQQKLFWEGASVHAIERIRVELRDIIKFLDAETGAIYFTMFQDEFDGQAMEHQVIHNYINLEPYRNKVENYIKEQSHHMTIYKLRNNISITSAELDELDRMLFEQGNIGSREEFVNIYGEQPLGKLVRSIVGLDINAAKSAFGEILSLYPLNAQQIRFLDMVINYLSMNGVIDPGKLFEAPFTELNAEGITGLFEMDTAQRIIRLIEEVNENAVA